MISVSYRRTGTIEGQEMIDDGAEPIRCATKATEKRRVVAGCWLNFFVLTPLSLADRDDQDQLFSMMNSFSRSLHPERW